MNNNDKLPKWGWTVDTLGQLSDCLNLLTPDELDFVIPKLKEWRERAIELQGEPAAMAVGMMQFTEERDRLSAIGTEMRAILCELAHDTGTSESTQALIDRWDQALVGAPCHLYQNSEVIYCARSLDRCWELFTQDTGIERGGEDGERFDPFELIPDDREMDVASDESSGDPTEELRDVKAKDGKVIGKMFFEKKTAKVWAAISREGHFSGGDY